MRLTKLTQVVIKMPDMPPEVLQGMKQEEIMEAQEIGDDQDFYINPEAVIAVYPNEHPKVQSGAILTVNVPPQMPPQIAVRESVEDVILMLKDNN